MPPSTVPLCLALVFGGLSLSLGFYVGRRQFYRRNSFGVQEFPNYRTAVYTTFFEKTLIVVSQLAGGLSVGLMLMFAIMHCGGADEPVEYKSQHAHRTTHAR